MTIESKNYERERDEVCEAAEQKIFNWHPSASALAFRLGADWGAAYERRRAEKLVVEIREKIINNSRYSSQLAQACFENIINDYAREALAAYEEVGEEFDPTPWCAACGAMKPSKCNCGPIAENE